MSNKSILTALRDLYRKATEEKSHYYTGSVLLAAILEIERLNAEIKDLRK